MDYIIRPADLNIFEKTRVCIKNIETNNFEKLVVLKPGGKYNFLDFMKETPNLNYKFKIQISTENGKWKDNTRYYIIKNYFSLNIDYLWLKNSSDSQRIIDFYLKYTGYESAKDIMKSFNKIVKHIDKAPLSELKNLKNYLQYVDSLDFKISSLWDNINKFLKHLYKFRIKSVELKLGNKTYLELKDDYNDNLFVDFLTKEIKNLKSYNLEFTYFLAGRYYSFLNQREEASICFNKFLQLDYEITEKMLMARGITTYYTLTEIKKNDFKNPIMINNAEGSKFNTTILLSVDEVFFRKFGIQLLFNIISLKQYNFHFHIVGDEIDIKKLISETNTLYKQMIEFYRPNMEIISPTYSFEEVPEFVKQKETYYACSRFLHADYFMDLFNNNILVIDADYTLMDDYSKIFKKLEEIDVGMSITNVRSCMSPWTRYMAGSVFFKNNINSKKFINHFKEYVSEGLKYENSWILDQNALCYASEKVLEENHEFNIQNIPYEIKPFQQTRVRYYIEEILPK